jgi:hypothetical protein
MANGLALLVSADPVTIQQFSVALHELSISSDVCQELPAAVGRLHGQKFDAVIVDLHLSPANRTAVTFAISSSGAEGAAFRKRSEFIFERPLSAKSIRSTLKPAYGLILRERRRYFRCPVSIPVLLLRQAQPEVHCNSVNISEGGMAISTSVSPNSGEKIHVQFTLPDHEVPFLAESDVCWGKPGQLGIRFLDLSREHKSVLQTWLSQKLEDTLPESVAGKFRKTEDLPPSED